MFQMSILAKILLQPDISTGMKWVIHIQTVKLASRWNISSLVQDRGQKDFDNILNDYCLNDDILIDTTFEPC